MTDDGHYCIESNDYFKVMGFDHGKYFFYSWLWSEVLVFTHRNFTVHGFSKLAPIEFWKANFPGPKGGFKRLTAMSAMMRLANSRGLVTP
jgi:putative DNA primase/helicase